jgi:hypothetical protein
MRPADAHTTWSARAGAVLIIGAAIACGVTFYWPQQLALYRDYSGLPASQPLDVAALYRAHLSNALVLTDNWYVYNYVLWPLNDPALRGTELYAFVASPDDITRVRAEYPSRQAYMLIVDSRGSVQFVPVPR